jgi:hypothetical protein
MKKLKLSQGKVALVDDEDYEWLNQWKWFAHKDCNTYYAGRSEKINGSRKQIWMHRAIMNTPLIILLMKSLPFRLKCRVVIFKPQRIMKH